MADHEHLAVALALRTVLVGVGVVAEGEAVGAHTLAELGARETVQVVAQVVARVASDAGLFAEGAAHQRRTLRKLFSWLLVSSIPWTQINT